MVRLAILGPRCAFEEYAPSLRTRSPAAKDQGLHYKRLSRFQQRTHTENPQLTAEATSKINGKQGFQDSIAKVGRANRRVFN
jgi:hypothetical protein